MKIIEVTQGSPEWAELRARHFCASEAPAMMGVSRFMSRSELLRQKHTGTAPDVDAATQARFDAGHAAEAATRPLVEALIDDELYPVVATDDEGWLLASFDGVNMAGETGFESKLWNEDLVAAVRAGDLPPMYYWQLEQQILVGGLERVIFACSDGTPEKFVHMEYRAVPGRAEQLIAGWKQFAADLSTYTPPEVIPAAVAEPVMSLPALSIQVNGSITLVDNLKVFGEKLTAFIEGLDKNPSDDQAFANTEQAIKVLGEAQTRLEAAEASALAQTASIDEMRRTVALYAGQARTTRLMLEKLVKARKEQIRVEQVQRGKDALAQHINGLNARLGKPYMPVIPADFAGVIKGKKTVSSLRDAIDTELARAKIAANEIADRIQINLATLAEAGHAFLFNDAATIVLKAPEDFAMLVKARIAEHEAAEQKRLEQERERIRAEEQARAEREARERAQREADEMRAAMARQAAEREAQAAAPVANAVRLEDAIEAHPLTEAEARRDFAAATKPSATVTPIKAKRPTDDEIIDVLSLHYRVHESVVLGWLLDFDHKAAGERLAAQFA